MEQPLPVWTIDGQPVGTVERTTDGWSARPPGGTPSAHHRTGTEASLALLARR